MLILHCFTLLCSMADVQASPAQYLSLALSFTKKRIGPPLNRAEAARPLTPKSLITRSFATLLWLDDCRATCEDLRFGSNITFLFYPHFIVYLFNFVYLFYFYFFSFFLSLKGEGIKESLKRNIRRTCALYYCARRLFLVKYSATFFFKIRIPLITANDCYQFLNYDKLFVYIMPILYFCSVKHLISVLW